MEHPVPIVTENSVMNYQRSFVTWLSGRSGGEAAAPTDKWKHVTPPADDSLCLHRTCFVTLSEVKRNSPHRRCPAGRRHVGPSRCLGDTSTGQKSAAPQGGPESSGTFCSSGCFVLFTMTLFTEVDPQGSLGSLGSPALEHKDVSSWVYASSPQSLGNLLNYRIRNVRKSVKKAKFGEKIHQVVK